MPPPHLTTADVERGGCMRVRVWAGTRECGAGFGEGVSASEQMELLTFWRTMAGAAEGTSAGDGDVGGGPSQVPASRCD